MKNLFYSSILMMLLIGCNRNKNFAYGDADFKEEKSVLKIPPKLEVYDNFDTIPSPATQLVKKPGKPKTSDPEEDIFQFVQQKPVLKIDSLLIKKATLEFQVENLAKSTQLLKNAVKSAGGYVSSATDTRNSYSLKTEFQIRVPNTRFETLLEEMQKQSILLENRKIETEDVTAEFVDTYSRIRAKREIENRYLAILQQAKTVEDILKVEAQLGSIREEIEAKQGRLQFLKDQVQYSTIQLTVFEKLPDVKEPGAGFFARLGTAFLSGWESLLNVMVGLVSVWWFWLLLVAGIYFGRKWSRELKEKKKDLKPVTQTPDTITRIEP